MREILFKAKRKDNGEWVEGYYSKDPDLNIHYISGWNYYCSEDGLEREPFDYEIIPYTLCQYTGMDDKNGNRIWENDVIQFEWNGKKYIKPVCFDNGKFLVGFNMTLDNIKWTINILGNKFDNPELLEVEK